MQFTVFCLLFFFNSKLYWDWVLNSQQIGLKTNITTNRNGPYVVVSESWGCRGPQESLVHSTSSDH